VPEQSIEIARLLVVSRESELPAPLRSVSGSNCWHVETAVDVRDAIERVQSGAPPNLLLIDVPRGDGDSRHVLRSLRKIDPSLPAIVVCFPEDAERNADAIRLGARELLIKPLDDDQLESVIRQCLCSTTNGKEEAASEDIEQLGRDSAFVSASPVSQKLRTQVQVLAEAQVPVLITGETGTGKDTVARLIHKLSIRSGFEFLKLNCAETPAALLDEELFGNVSQGNGKNGNGNLEVANNGTIFFDEITEMPLSTQSRLMQVLQNKASVKSSRSNGTKTGFRLLAATSGNVERAVAERRLREDLYCKLSAFTITVPPLRQRKEEIVLLMQHLMHRLSRQYGLAARTFSLAALSACKSYSWPGNLKELEAFVKRYLVVGDEDLLLNGMCSDLTNACGRRVLVAPELRAEGNRADDADPENEIEGGQTRPKSLKSIIQTVKSKAEKNAIEIALQRTGWNRKAAARILQVSYRGLLYKIDQYHLSAPHPYVGRFPYNGAEGSGGKEFKRN
jgi:DNA-binding NtrC family response regulator